MAPGSGRKRALPPVHAGPRIGGPVEKQAATPTGKVAAVAELTSQQPWSIEIYRVIDHDHQQRILKVIREIGQPSVVALGTQSGPDSFVIVEVSSLSDRAFAHRTIRAIDSHAARTYSSGRPQLAGPLPAS
jgi:hypothetical protein